jgi:hypothetical protein
VSGDVARRLTLDRRLIGADQHRALALDASARVITHLGDSDGLGNRAR